MKKIIGGLSGLMFALVLFVAPAHAATDWDVTGDWVFDYYYGGSNLHDMTLVQDEDGALTGTGGAFAGILPYAYPWTIVSGLVDGDSITLIADLDALACSFTLTGTIAGDGTMSGTWTDDCAGERAGTWETTSGAADNDSDNDGVLNGADLCPATTIDGVWDEAWGKNRMQVQKYGDDEELVWFQNKPAKKGSGTSPVSTGKGIDYTYGCNGHQILDMLEAELGAVMGGHHKFGLSNGLVEEFHLDLLDGELDGKYLIDTVTVDANDADGTASNFNLLSGHDYEFRVSGTAYACNELGCVIKFDADYSTSDNATWVDGVAAPYDVFGPNLLDLMVNGGFVNWGAYGVSHKYSYTTGGTDVPATFKVNDEYYPNNTGSLTVQIYAII
jgi:hypothetical protein